MAAAWDRSRAAFEQRAGRLVAVVRVRQESVSWLHRMLSAQVDGRCEECDRPGWTGWHLRFGGGAPVAAGALSGMPVALDEGVAYREIATGYAGEMRRAMTESDRRVPPAAMGGWLSPEGRYRPCSDCEHQETAEAIVRDEGLPTDHDAEKVLEEGGWVHVSDNGMVQSFLNVTVLFPDFTQAQLDVLFDLALAHPSMRKELMEELERARERSEREGPSQCRTTGPGRRRSCGSRSPTSRGGSLS